MSITLQSGAAVPRHDLRSHYVQFEQDINRLVCDKVAPPRPVEKPDGVYWYQPREITLALRECRRASNGGYQFTNLALKSDTFATTERGESILLDDRFPSIVRDVYDAQMAAARITMMNPLRWREGAGAQLIETSTNFPIGTRGHTTSAAWSTAASGDARKDVDTAKVGVWNNSGVQPNAICMSWKKALEVGRQTSIRGVLNSTSREIQPTQLSEAQLAEIFQVPYIFLADAPYNTVSEDQTAVIDSIWPVDNVFVFRYDPSNDPMMPNVFRTMHYNEDGSSGPLPIVEEYRNEDKRGSIIRARDEWEIKKQDLNLGWVIDTTP